MTFSRLYPIVDERLIESRGVALGRVAEELRAAGVGLVQYRNKTGGPQSILRDSAIIWEVFAGSGCRLILNDRADLVVLADFDGVHVGQGDLSPEDGRRVVGAGKWVGVSTHTQEQTGIAAAPGGEYVL